jgi:two-component system, OmpR family, response regulator
MTGPLAILCIDDDPDIRTIAIMALTLDPAITVRGAGSGAEAIALLRGDGWRPDAIMLDVMMPVMDGPATLAAIRALGGYDHVPVIFMTARARAADLDGYDTLGVDGVIVKPFDPMRLAEDVRALLAERGKG